jgi:capsule biosynthesis phosphatase
MSKRICLDLDGVIASLKKPGQTYRDLEPIPGAVEKMRALKAAGHYLIIQTARHMKTCGANVGLVNARIAKDTLDWLDHHGIPYDEIFFGKPWAQIYIDDNGFRFENWDQISDDASSLPGNREEIAGAGGNVG